MNNIVLEMCHGKGYTDFRINSEVSYASGKR